MNCSRCGSDTPNPSCYVCGEDPNEPFTDGEIAFQLGFSKKTNPYENPDDAADLDEGWEAAKANQYNNL